MDGPLGEAGPPGSMIEAHEKIEFAGLIFANLSSKSLLNRLPALLLLAVGPRLYAT